MEPVACLLGDVAVTRCVVYRKGHWTQTDHKFKPLDVTTTLNDGRKLEWSECLKCGQLMSKDGETNGL